LLRPSNPGHLAYNCETRFDHHGTMRSLDRNQVALHRSLAEADDRGYMAGTPEERILEVWELTREVWAFSRQDDAEQRLQRDAAVLVRGER
jgi:hypothetical protein